MALGFVLALLLAKVTPSSSPPGPIVVPTPMKVVNSSATTLTFNDALKRLISDALSDFVSDRGVKVVLPGGEVGYALAFGLEGFTN